MAIVLHDSINYNNVMQQNQIKKLEESGVDRTELMIEINLINLLPDVINTITWSFERKMKQAGLNIKTDKSNIKKLKALTAKMVRGVDCVLNSVDTSEKFASDSDELYNLIVDHCKKFTK